MSLRRMYYNVDKESECNDDKEGESAMMSRKKNVYDDKRWWM